MAKQEIKEKEEQAEGGGQGPKKKSSLMLYVIIGVVVLVLVGGGVTAAILIMGNSAEKKHAAPPPAIGPMWSMDPLIVNLADNNGERYLKIVLQLEVTTPDATKELDAIKPKLRDTVLDLLTNKTYRDLADNAGKQRLREEIMMRGNSMLLQGKITKVFFTDFVIQ